MKLLIITDDKVGQRPDGELTAQLATTRLRLLVAYHAARSAGFAAWLAVRHKPAELLGSDAFRDADAILFGKTFEDHSATALAAKQAGKRVLVVEKGRRVGGVSVHTRTIPSKTLRETVLNLSGWRERGFYGQNYKVKTDICANDLKQRLLATLDHEVEVLEHQFSRNNVERLRGTARFLSQHKIEVTDDAGHLSYFSFDKVLISVGTKPFRPESIPFDGSHILDSDEVLDLQHLPKSIVVIGAGVIGQVLIYPALGGDLGWPSYGQMASAPGLSTDDVIYYRDVLKAPMDDPVAYPLSAEDLRGLPPTYITAAYFDPLRDDGREYAARLARAGIDVTYREEPQMIHGWLRARYMSDGAATGFRFLCDAIKRMAAE